MFASRLGPAVELCMDSRAAADNCYPQFSWLALNAPFAEANCSAPIIVKLLLSRLHPIVARSQL